MTDKLTQAVATCPNCGQHVEFKFTDKLTDADTHLASKEAELDALTKERDEVNLTCRGFEADAISQRT
jgi:transcription elongation factor Elf1